MVVAERAKLLSVVQNQGRSEDDFHGRLRETARYFSVSELKQTADAKDKTLRMKFISGLRSADFKLKLLELTLHTVKANINPTDMQTVSIL